MADRRYELRLEAPMKPRGLWARGVWESHEVVYLCGTLGLEFDLWQRHRSAVSAADAYLSQQIGLEAIEQEMDRLEEEARQAIEKDGKHLRPRWSPGYGNRPLELSREILEKLDATRRIGVSLTDSLLLVPSKSVTAICEVVE